jgi:trans-aconitate methyltransferase
VPRRDFDAAYYRRFYSSSPVHSRAAVADLATGVHHLCAWWGIRIRSVLDVGAGPGYWRDWYRERHPNVPVHSVDVSEYACERFGHEKRDISEWRPSRPSDLVICHGVLHYLDADSASRAIENLAAAARHALYLEAPTTDDLRHVVDRDATDLEVHARSGQWYRTRLTKHFMQAGAGLWLVRDSGVALYELERGR